MIIQPLENATAETEVVHLWADGTWCDHSDLAEYLTFMSDDYESVAVTPEELETKLQTEASTMKGI